MSNFPRRAGMTVFLPALMALIVLSLLLSCGGNGTDPGNPPDITLFTANPVDIMPGDSSLVTFKALRADSLVLTPPRLKLADNDSGQVWVKPSVPTLYTLTAFNSDGTDVVTITIVVTPATAEITLLIADPFDIVPGDSALLTYMARWADSLLLYPMGLRLPEGDSGQVWMKPSIPQEYTLVAFSENGNDSASVVISMTSVTAAFQQFVALPDIMLVGDSSQLTWEAELADSIVVDHGIGKLADPVSGSVWVKPTATTQYRAVAYNIANDTATATLTVEVPVSVEALEGLYYKGGMGSSSLVPQLQIYVVDAQNVRLSLPWVHLSLIEGDGALSPDSAQPGSPRYVYPTYQFSGSLGHAVVRAKVREVDSADVYLRANTLIPGDGGQGQYILFSDTFATVTALNATPESVDADPAYWFNYVVYESSMGVVVMVWDENRNRTADNDEAVMGIIVNSIYSGTTADGIGIGSHYNDIEAVYGAPDTSYQDPTLPVADVYIYDDPPMTLFANPADSVVFEIHLYDPDPQPLSQAGASLKPDRADLSASAGNAARPYRRAVR